MKCFLLVLLALVASTLTSEEGQNESSLDHLTDERAKRELPETAVLRNVLEEKDKQVLQQMIDIVSHGGQPRVNNELFVASVSDRKKGYNDDRQVPTRPATPLPNKGLFEGDIMLDKDDMNAAYGRQNSDLNENDAKIQKFILNRKWPNGIIPYEIDNNFQFQERQIILRAIGEYEEKTCLRFKETRSARSTHLFITSEGGCWSYVGRHPNMRRQTISLSNGCVILGTVIHELGHAIGFWHEQSRPDRDRYIMIHRENIRRGHEHNFNVRRNSDYHGKPYNFGSVMHYEETGFSWNGRPTISVRDELLYELEDKPHIGQRFGQGALTEIDARQINKHYGCHVPNSSPGTLTVQVPEAGPFQEPGHYSVCVRATDSKGNQRQQCSRVDGVSTTDPSWDETFVFKSIDRVAMFYSFEITVRRRNGFRRHDSIVVNRQTIWVEAREYRGSFCVTKALCVPYHYKID